MQLTLKRIAFRDTYTIGKLYIDSVYFCDTIEDKYRDLSKEKKVYGKTCIPYGTYEIQMTFSPHFKRVLPLLLDVPQFSGILIHNGNTDKDSLGCIIVGKNKVVGKVIDSNITLAALLEKISKETDLSITII